MECDSGSKNKSWTISEFQSRKGLVSALHAGLFFATACGCIESSLCFLFSSEFLSVRLHWLSKVVCSLILRGFVVLCVQITRVDFLRK